MGDHQISRVTYSANVKFTVVISFDAKLKDAWTSASSEAVHKIEKAIASEIGLNRQNTLLLRKMSLYGTSLKLASVPSDQKHMLSMRLAPHMMSLRL